MVELCGCVARENIPTWTTLWGDPIHEELKDSSILIVQQHGDEEENVALHIGKKKERRT